MLVLKPGSALDIQALALSDDGVEGKPGIFPRQQLHNIHIQLIGAFIQKGKAKILLSILMLQVFLQLNAGGLSHLLRGDIHHFPQALDSLCYFYNSSFHFFASCLL